MILKAGTYRFNEAPSIPNNFEQSITFTIIDGTQIVECNAMSVEDNTIADRGDGITYNTKCLGYSMYVADYDTYFAIGVYNECDSFKEWSTPLMAEDILRNTTLPTDQEVDDTFGTWYISNTNYNEVNTPSYLATIEYNGQTIAQLNAGETAVIKCGPTEDTEYKMASDIAVKIESGYVKPSGSLSITENGTYPVADKAEVDVDVPIPDGYVKPEGTLEITLNNIEANPIDCSQYAKVTVNTAEPLKITDPTVLDNITDSPWGVGGSVFLYEGTTTDSYENGVLYYLEDTEK